MVRTGLSEVRLLASDQPAASLSILITLKEERSGMDLQWSVLIEDNYDQHEPAVIGKPPGSYCEVA